MGGRRLTTSKGGLASGVVGAQLSGALARKKSGFEADTLSSPMRSKRKQTKNCKKNQTKGGVFGKRALNHVRTIGGMQGCSSSSTSESGSSFSSSSAPSPGLQALNRDAKSKGRQAAPSGR